MLAAPGSASSTQGLEGLQLSDGLANFRRMSVERPPILGMMWPDRCDQERHWLFRNSEVFRYAMEGSTAAKGELLIYVSEQCVAAGRLMQVAISQYESVASGLHGSYHDSRTLPAWAFISSAFSAIDAVVSAVGSIITGEVPTDEKIPGISMFDRFFKDCGMKGHAMVDKVAQLRDSTWYSAIQQARHRVLHRGYWPLRSWHITGDDWHVVHSAHFLGVRKEGPGEDPTPRFSRGTHFDMKAIAAGLLWDLEAWEASIAIDLANAGTITSVWSGPVRQVIRLQMHDHMVPEACFLMPD